ncbi:hypothetical protein PM038_04240 [Halorubrum ezzemoulense]|uniref:hypothetical protein n=1 Tax=Halorubrum ezzemoulense TaxID=337243 RepID=UPI00232CBC09|nr:hypothetical protein [Halorubrum ezzemoulense]MDB2284480.1 hypothetical protein [Halorubrum ezzemoulense]
MWYLDDRWIWKYAVGDHRPRRILIVSVVGLLVLSSIAFLSGVRIGLYEFWGWIVIVPAIAAVAGVVGSGLVPTISSVWLISVWGYVFPPLVGYLTGEWSGAGRYTHPRMLGFAYGSARAELLGGIETSVNFGLMLALVIGTLGYVSGSIIRRLSTRVQSS